MLVIASTIFKNFSSILKKQKQGQGRGVAAPLDAFISLYVQRNEAKKTARTPCLPTAGFPPCDTCFEKRQKLASLKHLPLFFSNLMTHYGCVIRETIQKQAPLGTWQNTTRLIKNVHMQGTRKLQNKTYLNGTSLM